MVPESRQRLVLILLEGGMFKSLLCSVLKSSSQIKKRDLCIEQLRNQNRSLIVLSWLGYKGIKKNFFDWCLPLSIHSSNNTVYAATIWQDEYFPILGPWRETMDKGGDQGSQEDLSFLCWWKVSDFAEGRLPWSFLPLRTLTDAEWLHVLVLLLSLEEASGATISFHHPIAHQWPFFPDILFHFFSEVERNKWVSSSQVSYHLLSRRS